MAIRVGFIGATGMLGKPVAREFINSGMDVSALVRDPAKAANDIQGLKTTKGDLRNTGELAAFFKDRDVVYLNLSVKQNEKRSEFHTEAEGMKNIIAAAKQSGIKRIVYLSSLIMNYNGMNGFSWWVFDVKKQAVKDIRESGIPYTIFYPSNFMESLNHIYMQGSKMMLAGTSKQKMYFISAHDYARQAARSILSMPGGNREYYVQGPQGFTADEAVREFMSHYKKQKLSLSRAPLGLIKFMGLLSTKMNYGAHILEALNNYPETFVSQKTWDELGEPVITIKNFASGL